MNLLVDWYCFGFVLNGYFKFVFVEFLDCRVGDLRKCCRFLELFYMIFGFEVELSDDEMGWYVREVLDNVFEEVEKILEFRMMKRR